MGLCSLTTRRLDIPDEDGQWVELRPLSMKTLQTIGLEAKKIGRDALAANTDDDSAENMAYATLLLGKSIVAWSYEAEVNAANIDDLETETTKWLVDEIGQKAGIIPLASTPPSTESSEAEAETPLTDGQSQDSAKSSDVDPQS